MKSRIGFAIVGVMCAILLTGCEFWLDLGKGSEEIETIDEPQPIPLSVEISVVNENYAYGDEVTIQLTITSEPETDIEITWAITPAIDLSSFLNSETLSLTLEPDITTDYSIVATITSGEEEISVTREFVVNQLPFLGTWKAVNQYSPAYFENMDIVGIWFMNGFHLYYLDPNGGTEIRTYSAKGTMTFPHENEWMTLTQTHYYREDISDWDMCDENLYVKYNYLTNLLEMRIGLNLNSPTDPVELTWTFEKMDDSVDGWW
ncbi:MAG: hypothetical protein KKI09_02130 [Spirochaetes bacterium]|nr:hypothetical protein [Spirochaetota bacterium]